MAIISTFELLAKRIGPPGGISSALPISSGPFRKYLQGYFLTIANPNDRELLLRMQAVFPQIDPPTNTLFTAAQRELLGGANPNHVYAYDRTGYSIGAANPREILGNMEQLTSTAQSRTFQTVSFSLDPFQTGLLNLLPNPSELLLPDPQIEVRGYIKLVQVITLEFVQIGPGLWQLIFVTPPPVDLLLTPEIRGTFIDEAFNPALPAFDLDFDQANYALPLSTGQAMLTVSETINPFFFPIASDPDAFQAIDYGRFIDIDKLTGSLNSLDEFVLSEDSIKYLGTVLEKAEVKAETRALRAVKSQVEGVINRFGRRQEQGYK